MTLNYTLLKESKRKSVYPSYYIYLFVIQVNTYLNLFEAETTNRQLYNHLMNQCVNLHLKKYGLSAESTIEYCDKNNNVIELGMYEKHLGYIDASLIFYFYRSLEFNILYYYQCVSVNGRCQQYIRFISET